MENVVLSYHTVYDRIHKFRCDKCGKLLGTEYEKDGSYRVLGKPGFEFWDGSDWYMLKGHYCEECANEIKGKVVSCLTDLGFKKGLED